MARVAALVVTAVLGAAWSADARLPRSVAELPPGQYPIEGLAGTKVVSTPPSVPCSDDPRVIVGIRFRLSAKRVPYARGLSHSGDGKAITVRRFRNTSRRWRFGTLRLTRGCGVLHGVDYSFHRPGDRSGQRLGDWVCVLGPDGERCPIPDEEGE